MTEALQHLVEKKFKPEVITFMADRGVFLFDVAGSLRRPLENDLAQLELVFVSASSPMVSSNRWM